MHFDESQKQLNQVKAERRKRELEIRATKEKLDKIGRNKRSASRQSTDRAAKLAKQEEALKERVEDLKTRLTEAKGAESTKTKEFLSFSDPRDHVSSLNDGTPILLFPLRIETRFKSLRQPGAPVTAPASRRELWVRVFPDDIAVDSFEPLLSETEVRNAASYYLALWRAFDDVGQARAAWRSLVASHGSGRAHWIIQNYQPLNSAEKPVKSEDVILIIPTESVLTAEEQSDIKAYLIAALKGEDGAWADLVAAVGEPRAAEIIEHYKRANPPSSVPENFKIEVVFLHLPNATELDTKLQGWTQSPRTHLLPERLVLLAFNIGQDEAVIEAIGEPLPSFLAVGPDPSLGEDQQIYIEDGNLVVNEEMKWMVDFEEAVAKGMGFRIPLTDQQAKDGFDELYVLGVKLSVDSIEGKQAVETLIDHHHHSRSGFRLVRQGTPTNNTDKEGAGYSWQEDSNESFDRYFLDIDPPDPLDWEYKKDGRVLAEMLGIDAAILQPIAHYYCTDQAEAKAMQHALWPATLGYFMESTMEPVFSDATIRRTRDFFTRYVSGRGAIPAISVGKQPYGILPATPFRRMLWLRRAGDDFLLRLYGVLNVMSSDWGAMLNGVSHVAKDGDPHQLLLDIVGLHPSSVEFHSRQAQGFEHILNTLNLQGLGGALIALLTAGGYAKSGMDLLAKFGSAPANPETGTPDVLRKFWFDRGDMLKGPLIDDVPLSETEAVRDYTDDGRNYIEWLIDAANTSHNAMRQQQGFTDNKPPAALLYLMLQHALDLGYVDADLRLRVSNAILKEAEMAEARREPAFVHIQERNGRGSRWEGLYKADARITGDNNLLVGDYIPSILRDSDEVGQLKEQLVGLESLKYVPTARLERLFVEHLDLCTYRLDAWIQGLVHYQLDTMRNRRGEVQAGIYLGAYGWLVNLRPENKILQPVDLEPELAKHFTDPQHPLTNDSTNGGYIHALSTNHAVTAAVLRNGYLENASAENPDSFAVNLSSERVRLALCVIEGMQAGQSLSALLGYQLERGLHDRHAMEVDEIIYNLRLAFPLRSNRLKSTKVENLDSIDTVEARNVVDGLSLLEHIQKTGNGHYPFDHPKLPDNLSGPQKQAIDAEVERIQNINDAVADLAIAESVHQVVQGNYDRAAATLDTYSKGSFPPTPDVIKTPRSGVTLTYRVGLQFETELNPAAAENKTPRSKAEPAINRWLASILPDMDALACKVSFATPAGATQTESVTLDMLGLQPIDVLYMVNLESTQAMTLLDDAISLYILRHFDTALDSDITLRYTDTVSGKVSLHEAAPLIRSLKAMISRSRPLKAGDVSLVNETSQEATRQNIALDKSRITLNRDALDALKTQLTDYADALSALLAPEDADLIMHEADDLMQVLAVLLQELSLFGLPQTGSGFIWQWQRMHFRALSERINKLAQRQQKKLLDFDAIVTQYAGLPGSATPEERYGLLQTAERFISTARTDTTALTPNEFRDDLLNTGKAAFEQWTQDTVALLTNDSLSDTYAALLDVLAALPNFDTPESGYDTVEFDLNKEREQLFIFAGDLLAKARSVRDILQERLDEVDELLTQHDDDATAPEKVDALLSAGKQLFGADFKLVPEFAISAAQAVEWQNAYDNVEQLHAYQVDTLEEDFPVDNWLYGMARVREKMGHVENATIMAEALAEKTLSLTPVQLPYREADSWLALEYPQTTPHGERYVIDEDKLLYTAHYAVDFDSSKTQCGLLLDEWTEVIPGTHETTGLVFHYDRPNSEPPQTLLLATPADFTGKWQWQDLVDTLRDTLDLAKKRAVEPEQINRTAYARFLPALVSAFTVYPITPSLNLALNNQFYQLKDTEDE